MEHYASLFHPKGSVDFAFDRQEHPVSVTFEIGDGVTIAVAALVAAVLPVLQQHASSKIFRVHDRVTELPS